MNLRLSDLPPELRRQLAERMGMSPVSEPRRHRVVKPRSRLMRRCPCGFEIFRPNGIYPEDCDGCGKPWPAS
jgi:hypothetical protein